MPKPYTAGAEIDAYCTKCRMDLGHRIVALVEGRPKRVICSTCGSEHNYRASEADAKLAGVRRTAPRAVGARAQGTRTTRSQADSLRQWESKIAGQAATAFVRYSVDKSFKAGQLLLHKTFGEGCVMEVLDGNKVAVLFRGGIKTLVHDRPD
jgi:hypothetical protein